MSEHPRSDKYSFTSRLKRFATRFEDNSSGQYLTPRSSPVSSASILEKGERLHTTPPSLLQPYFDLLNFNREVHNRQTQVMPPGLLPQFFFQGLDLVRVLCTGACFDTFCCSSIEHVVTVAPNSLPDCAVEARTLYTLKESEPKSW